MTKRHKRRSSISCLTQNGDMFISIILNTLPFNQKRSSMQLARKNQQSDFCVYLGLILVVFLKNFRNFQQPSVNAVLDLCKKLLKARF